MVAAMEQLTLTTDTAGISFAVSVRAQNGLGETERKLGFTQTGRSGKQ
jgi:hypothetical protein